MRAKNFPVRKVKSSNRMADVEIGSVKIAANGEIELAQVLDVSYGCCFGARLGEYCYWYPVSGVVTDTWMIRGPGDLGASCLATAADLAVDDDPRKHVL